MDTGNLANSDPLIDFSCSLPNIVESRQVKRDLLVRVYRGMIALMRAASRGSWHERFLGILRSSNITDCIHSVVRFQKWRGNSVRNRGAAEIFIRTGYENCSLGVGRHSVRMQYKTAA